jgi:hypothetical protein
MELNRQRINATGERIVRGLYFIEVQKPIPAEAKVKIACKPGITVSDPAILQYARMYSSCGDRRNKAVGDAFSYAVAFHPQYSLWLLMLYGHFTWLATVAVPTQ